MKSILEIFSKKQKTNKYPDVVYEIHRNFYTASDKLLEEANKIISTSGIVNEGKIDRLKRIGFNKVKEVADSIGLIDQKKISIEMSKIVQYYILKYPNHKFITEDSVKSICEKYSLVFGSIVDFTGFVPDKNLKDIENFKLKEEDYVSVFKYGSWSDQYLTLSQLIDELSNSRSEESILLMASELQVVKKIQDKFRICAPLKDFDQTGKSVKGYKLVKIAPDDPVVLQPVPGGYLIVTAWGDEASDPLVVNSKMN